MSYWVAYDAVTFLVDLGRYHPALHEFLTRDEKEQESHCRTTISRQRFVVSRTFLKYILSGILSGENIVDIHLIRSGDGRILVKDQTHVYICLSYSGTTLAITVGKRKLGSDIEEVRPIRDKKITASPLFTHHTCTPDKEHVQQVIHVWTLIESYAKLYDTNPYPLLTGCSAFGDADFVSYSIHQHMIFSLAMARGHFTDVLVWLDM